MFLYPDRTNVSLGYLANDRDLSNRSGSFNLMTNPQDLLQAQSKDIQEKGLSNFSPEAATSTNQEALYTTEDPSDPQISPGNFQSKQKKLLAKYENLSPSQYAFSSESEERMLMHQFRIPITASIEERLRELNGELDSNLQEFLKNWVQG